MPIDRLPMDGGRYGFWVVGCVDTRGGTSEFWLLHWFEQLLGEGDTIVDEQWI